MIELILVTIITIIELIFGLKNYIFQQYVFITLNNNLYGVFLIKN